MSGQSDWSRLVYQPFLSLVFRALQAAEHSACKRRPPSSSYLSSFSGDVLSTHILVEPSLRQPLALICVFPSLT